MKPLICELGEPTIDAKNTWASLKGPIGPKNGERSCLTCKHNGTRTTHDPCCDCKQSKGHNIEMMYEDKWEWCKSP